MEKPIECYEVALEYAKANGVAVSDEEVAALIAMVKARDAEIKTFQHSGSLAYENVVLQTQLDQQLCATRTLEKAIAESIELLGKRDAEIDNQAREIAELKQAVIYRNILIQDLIDPDTFESEYDGTTIVRCNHCNYENLAHEEACSITIARAAIASQQGGEVK